jgi:HSP20 family molecular chaperone IbpA
MATVVERNKDAVSNTAAEQIRESGRAFRPDVDIYASEEELLFLIELPGVSKGNVAIRVDENETLTIQGKNSAEEPENPVFRQYQSGNFYRAFQIGRDYDKDRIGAKLENGLLELRIPKREEAKPRRIEISA